MTAVNRIAMQMSLESARKNDLVVLEEMSQVESDSKYTKDEFKMHGIIYIHHFFKNDECVLPGGKIVDFRVAEKIVDERLVLAS